MKRILSCLLIIVLMLSFAGCSKTKKAEEAVVSAFDALQVLDYAGANEYINVEAIHNFQPSYDLTGRSAEMFMDNLFERLDCKIISSKKVDSKTVNVTAEITAVKMLPLLAEFFYVIIEDSTQNPEYWQTEEMIYNGMDLIFESCAAQQDLEMVTTKVEIKVTKKDGKWKIVTDEVLIDAIYGGFKEASTEINNVLAQ